MGGSNDSDNLVHLTAKEHFVAHMLLIKITEGLGHTNMIYAFHLMASVGVYDKQHITSRLFQTLREEFAIRISEAQKGRIFSEETKRKMSEAAKGRKRGPHSEESKRKMSEAAKKRKLSEAAKGKPLQKSIGESYLKQLRVKTHSEEAKRKMSEAAKGRNSFRRSQTEDI